MKQAPLSLSLRDESEQSLTYCLENHTGGYWMALKLIATPLLIIISLGAFLLQ